MSIECKQITLSFYLFIIIIYLLLQVYVTWAGTDKNGEDLTTASSRFSRISSTQVSEYVKDLQSISNVDSAYAFYS